tara:strand:- start:76 stop:444 length:369 start_codon:yes stop_codon:yes gene_type:complete
MTPSEIKSHYSIKPDPEGKDRACVIIDKGPFKGVVVSYGRFQFADKDNEDGTTKARYEYDMISIPPEMEEEVSDLEGKEFEYLLGLIYIHVVSEELEAQKQEIEDQKHRKYDFTKPVLKVKK